MKVKVKVSQSCPTLWEHMDYTEVCDLSLLQGVFPTQGSNPGLRIAGGFFYQLNHEGSPRILEWVAYPISRGST